MGMVGGIVGGIVGIAGGLIGAYFSIRNTKGSREKRFMIKSAAIAWCVVIIFLLSLFYLPKPYNFLMWIPYGILLPVAIIYMNKKQNKIREEERKGK